jgi:hypothetical protein
MNRFILNLDTVGIRSITQKHREAKAELMWAEAELAEVERSTARIALRLDASDNLSPVTQKLIGRLILKDVMAAIEQPNHNPEPVAAVAA